MKTLPVAIVLGVWSAWPLAARAETPSEIPNPLTTRRAFVADNAQVLPEADEKRLDDYLKAIEKRTSDEFAVVTVRTLGGQDIESFGDELARGWKIGKAGKNNGILLLIAINERKSRIDVGYGLSDKINDARAGEILRETTRPKFRRGDYAGGIFDATNAIGEILAPNLAPSTASNPENNPSGNRPARPYSAPDYSSSGSEVPTFPNAPRYSSPTAPGGGGFLLFLTGGGALAVGLAYALTRPRKCRKCGGVCKPLDQVEESKRLKEGEIWEERLGARDYTIWKCTQCANEELEVKDRFFSSYQNCRRCGYKTCSASTQTLEYATEYHEGVERVTYRCALPSCGETWSHNRTTPRLPRRSTTIITGVGTGIGSTWGSGSSSSGGWGSSANDSGPSSFGGGDFGGDGASSDW